MLLLSQQPKSVELRCGSSDVFEVAFHDGTEMLISSTGELLHWTCKEQNVQYYGPALDRAIAGKPRYIDRISVQYFNSSVDRAIRGNVRYLGNLSIVYFNSASDEDIAGKIWHIGNHTIGYWQNGPRAGRVRSFDGRDVR